jgi:uncharacterized membrane protein
MQISVKQALIGINVVSVLLVLIVIGLPNNPLRIVIGLPFLLFSPGYALTVAVFPKRHLTDIVEKVLLWFALSVVVVSVIAFAMNYTPWGVRLYPVLIADTSFVFLLSIIGYFRQGKTIDDRRRRSNPSLKTRIWFERLFQNKSAASVAGLAILSSIVLLVYSIATMKTNGFTEFYLLDSWGDIRSYPKDVVLGERATVILGIVNREGKPMDYDIKVTSNGKPGFNYQVALATDEANEKEIELVFGEKGANQKTEFVLYRNDQEGPYITLALTVSVEEGSQASTLK